jgi:16S rRNA (guanine527-N7)-methyltransferase
MPGATNNWRRMNKQATNEFRSALETAVWSFGLDPLSEAQIGQCAAHYELLCRWNSRVNLTRITEPREAARFHYAESIFSARFIANERTILDIGSGAGFPAIPLAIVRPDLEVTGLEANKKKSLFLKEAKHELRLENLKVVTARLEEFNWAGYELLTCRALDRAETILPSVITALNARHRLMLFSTRELAEKLAKRAGEGPRFELYAIPRSEARILAIVTRE